MQKILSSSASKKNMLFLICITSICLIVMIDNIAYSFFNFISPSLKVIAQLRLPSLSMCYLIYRFSKSIIQNHSFINSNSRTAIRTSLFWIIPTAYFVLVKKVWVPEISTWIDITAFMVTGLIAEELLFRGAIFELTKEVMPKAQFGRFSAAILISALFFGLQHFSYHHFNFSQAAFTQVIYTFIMGIVFALVRESSGKLWPVILLHIITNSFTLIRNFNP